METICPRCEKSFLKNRKDKIYCSRNCKQEASSKRTGRKKNRPRKGYKYLNAYRRHKKGECELCGFIPIHSCQLDVDHIDGNHGNNEVSNLQTLCANCHRLKTYLNRDWESR